MRAIIDRGLCTGCGLCVELCPDVFAIEEYVARARIAEIPAAAEAACRRAARECPLAAIELR
jgi:ferredoxin